MNRNKKIALVAATASIAVAGLGSAAYAYWTTGGTADGSAGVGSATAFTVAQTSTVTGLVPGGTAQPVTISVTNPATTAQYLTSVTFALKSVTPASGAVGSCGTGDFTIVQPTSWTTPRDLTAGEVVSVAGGTIAMKNTSSNQDGCKNATVNLTLTAA